jgi:hypothetical protein
VQSVVVGHDTAARFDSIGPVICVKVQTLPFQRSARTVAPECGWSSPTAMQNFADRQEMPRSSLVSPGALGVGTMDHTPAVHCSASVNVLWVVDEMSEPTAMQ